MTSKKPNDIVERLRKLYVDNGTNYVQEAANEIETLRQRVALLEVVIKDLAQIEAGTEAELSELRMAKN